MKATEQCFRVVLFIMLYKVVLLFASVDEVIIQMKAREKHFPMIMFVFQIFKKGVRAWAFLKRS